LTDLFEERRGGSPLLISFPHDGTEVPDDVRVRFTEAAGELRDTDWHVAELYKFVQAMDVSTIRPHYSRYLVDLNRPPEPVPLYPGKFETAVCPLSCFSLDPIYRTGTEPNDAEIRTRIATYWRPYHEHIEMELRRLKAVHGYALLLDAHSVPGRVPSLFSGELPELNFGTNGGASCAAWVTDAVMALAGSQTHYSHVLNGRFKGGYITRHYGRPAENVHAVQLEINQNTYLETGKFVIDGTKADRLRVFLRQLVEKLMTPGRVVPIPVSMPGAGNR
jgi:N-formylglutamate deformylase